MNATHQSEATVRFLDAWKAASKPPVEKVVYPAAGNSRVSVLFSHSEIALWADAQEGSFSDDGRFVEIGWDYRSNCFDLPGGSAKLIFDRQEPIQSGRKSVR